MVSSEKSEDQTCSNALKAISEARVTTERIKNLLKRTHRTSLLNENENSGRSGFIPHKSSNTNTEELIKTDSECSTLNQQLQFSSSNVELGENLIKSRNNQKCSEIDIDILTDKVFKDLLNDCLGNIPQRQNQIQVSDSIFN